MKICSKFYDTVPKITKKRNTTNKQYIKKKRSKERHTDILRSRPYINKEINTYRNKKKIASNRKQTTSKYSQADKIT